MTRIMNTKNSVTKKSNKRVHGILNTGNERSPSNYSLQFFKLPGVTAGLDNR